MTIEDKYFLIKGQLFAPQSNTSNPARLVVKNTKYYVEINGQTTKLAGKVKRIIAEPLTESLGSSTRKVHLPSGYIFETIEYEKVDRLKGIGSQKSYAMPVIFMIGLSFFAIRTLLDSRFGTGTLLYLIVPFVTSALLYFFTKPIETESIGGGFVNHIRLVTIIFLMTSAFLMEGFLCVLFFMPIYYFMALIGFFFAWLMRDRSSLKSMSLPIIVAALSIEGMLPETTFPRQNTATYIAQTNQNIETLKFNMAKEIIMPKKRGWLLSVFPLPDKISAGTLIEGDTHNLHFTYKKWGVGNFHKGEMDILISKVDATHIQTRITKNTAYLANYAKIEGTDVHFTPLYNGGTEVSLTVKYERSLDPVWYFGPMQKIAAEQSAKYLVDNIIIRKPT